MNPAQTACRSKAKPLSMPIMCWTRVAVEGKVWSGVAVARTIASMSRAREAGGRQRPVGGACRQVRSQLAVGRDVALADACAGADPLV